MGQRRAYGGLLVELGYVRVLFAWAEQSGEEVGQLGKRKGGVLAQGENEERKRI